MVEFKEKFLVALPLGVFFALVAQAIIYFALPSSFLDKVYLRERVFSVLVGGLAGLISGLFYIDLVKHLAFQDMVARLWGIQCVTGAMGQTFIDWIMTQFVKRAKNV